MCEVGVETVGRPQGVEEKYFPQRKPYICMFGSVRLPFQANIEAG